VDVHVHQVASAPELFVSVDRVRAGQLGLTERDVASSLLISLSGSGQTNERTCRHSKEASKLHIEAPRIAKPIYAQDLGGTTGKQA
jgi:multidrug efflux pump subunit AcrB